MVLKPFQGIFTQSGVIRILLESFMTESFSGEMILHEDLWHSFDAMAQSSSMLFVCICLSVRKIRIAERRWLSLSELED